MSSQMIILHDSRSAAPTILGQRAPRIPTCGKIRAGIKVLTQAAAANAMARRLYRDGVEAGHTFEQIEAALRTELPGLARPLAPKNVNYFVVRPADFANPAMAAAIMDLYAEAREDGVRRLYRFPVIFPSDIWQTVMPHELACYGQSGRRYWSAYDGDGVRRCMRHAEPASANGRAVRVFGGRAQVLRADNGGVCQPECCREYQGGECNLSGSFVFLVPGLRTLDALELHTNSYYAMSRAVEKFRALDSLRDGRLSGYLDDDGATFYLSKRRRKVSRLDEQGRPVMTEHWLIELDADADITAILRRRDQAAQLVRAEHAARALNVVGAAASSGADELVEALQQDALAAANGRGGAAQRPLRDVTDITDVQGTPAAVRA